MATMCLWDRIKFSKLVDRAPDPAAEKIHWHQWIIVFARQIADAAAAHASLVRPNHGRRAQCPCARDAHCTASGPAGVLTPLMPVGHRCLSLLAAQPGNRTTTVKDSNHSNTTI